MKKQKRSSGVQSDIGDKSQQQDRYFRPQKHLSSQKLERLGYLYAVADGMGGHQGGDRASEIAVSTLQAFYSDAHVNAQPDQIQPLMAELVENANRAIFQTAQRNRDLHGMGTTLSALIIREDRWYLSHVGDSRIYQWRDGVLTQLSHDHTMIDELIRMGRFDKDDIADDPMLHRLLLYLGSESAVTPQQQEGAVNSGDRYLLCSDGLTDLLSEKEIGDHFYTKKPQKIADQLIERALRSDKSNIDNITALVIAVD
jgi:protein phosphatase